jgi:hypothetical protein
MEVILTIFFILKCHNTLKTKNYLHQVEVWTDSMKLPAANYFLTD